MKNNDKNVLKLYTIDQLIVFEKTICKTSILYTNWPTLLIPAEVSSVHNLKRTDNTTVGAFISFFMNHIEKMQKNSEPNMKKETHLLSGKFAHSQSGLLAASW